MSPAPRFLAFRVGAARAALPLTAIREVIEAPRVVAVPGARQGVAGVALARGVALPVYDLERAGVLRRNGAAEPPGEAPSLIVCGWGEALIGFFGAAADVVEGEIDRPSGALSGGAASGGRTRGGEALVMLDPARLFATLGVPVVPSGRAGEERGEEDSAGR